jgi:hypothetical protein
VTEGRGLAAVSALRHRTKFLSLRSFRLPTRNPTTAGPALPGRACAPRSGIRRENRS